VWKLVNLLTVTFFRPNSFDGPAGSRAATLSRNKEFLSDVFYEPKGFFIITLNFPKLELTMPNKKRGTFQKPAV